VQLVGCQIESFEPLPTSTTRCGATSLLGGPHFGSPVSCLVLAVTLDSLKTQAGDLSKVARWLCKKDCHIV
jgi:hypothetical protein